MSGIVSVERVVGRRYVDDSFEYLVKFKNTSYLHTEWLDREKLELYSDSKNQAQRFVSNFERTCAGDETKTIRIPDLENFKTVERIVTHEKRNVVDDENTVVGWRISDEKEEEEEKEEKKNTSSTQPIWCSAKPPRSVRRGEYFSYQIPTEDDVVIDNQLKEFQGRKFQVRVPRGMKSNASVYFNCRDAIPIGVNLFRVEGHANTQQQQQQFKRRKGQTLLYFVKWKDLSYRHATWERECDIDDDVAIGRYFRRYNMENTKKKNHLEKQLPLVAPKQFKGNRELRSYQVQGVNWLLRRWFSKSGAILADEMGLGKTVQVVATLEALRKRATPRISESSRSLGGGPFLVIVPLSVLEHWQREFESWTDMEVCTYYSSSSQGPGMTLNGAQRRELKRKYEWYFGNDRRPKFDVLLTTYEVLQKDVKCVCKFQFRALIVDEGHRLRSHKAHAKSIISKVRTEWRVILTGTPLQNNLQELWSLLNFVAPEKFTNVEQFLNLYVCCVCVCVCVSSYLIFFFLIHSLIHTHTHTHRYGNMQNDTSQLTALKQKLSSYVLRREKEDVEKSIPAKVETIIDVELTTLQKKYYRAIYEKNRTFLCKGGSGPSLRNVHMQLRKCCNHPYLIDGVEKRVLAERHEDQNIGDDGDTPKARVNHLVECCGKLVLVDKLLPKLKKEGHRVLIFSQMVRVLDILEDYLVDSGYEYERIDGGVIGNRRQRAIDRFCEENSNIFVFLLSTRAGGVGINLTAADTVVIFDSDWNPQNDMQATARCHRIGQMNEVKVYRLLTRNTYVALSLSFSLLSI